jgi:O-antigen ligase
MINWSGSFPAEKCARLWPNAFVREAPIIGHGTGSIPELFRRSTLGQVGAAAVASINPHNQVLAVAIQLGLTGAAMLFAMWSSHYLLFCGANLAAWIGTVVVVENVVSSMSSSHLFDFVHGWIYVFGVGVLGGTQLRLKTNQLVLPKTGDERSEDFQPWR